MKFMNLDENETVFFDRELESVKSKTYDKRYPMLKATRVIPVSGEAGSGAESITYQQYDRVGLMKIISNYADDLPRSDVFGKEFTSPVRSLGGGYGYTIQEVRNSNMAGKSLPIRKASASRQAYEETVNKIGWLADGSNKYYGLTGLLYNANITKASPSTGNWIAGGATPAQIIKDVTDSVNNMRDLTKGVEEPDTILLPVKEYGHISTTARGTGTDTTILTFLRSVLPGITFEWINELSNVSPAPSGGSPATNNVMITYKKDLDKLSFEIPQGYEQFPAQERNLEYVIPAHGRNGGVIVYYPLSITLTEGI